MRLLLGKLMFHINHFGKEHVMFLQGNNWALVLLPTTNVKDACRQHAVKDACACLAGVATP